MKAVIFAGGAGTRMWPVSRKASPKQFEKLIGDKSTLQLAVDRLRPEFDWADIFISTGAEYAAIIRRQVPLLPETNLIAEPEMRDVAAAVGYVATIFAKTTPRQPFVILWSDHLMTKVDVFKAAIFAGADYIKHHQNQILLIGQTARFPNQNCGWIEVGKTIGKLADFPIHEFKSLHYRPSIPEARVFFHRHSFSWNPGYFIATPEFLLDQYRRYMPEMHNQLLSLNQSNLKTVYPRLERISFDNAILERLAPKQAIVVSVDMGWSDIGTWEALKEALQKHSADNIITGKVIAYQTHNSLIYNYTDKLVATLDLEGMLVVITPDVIMVCPQESVPQIKKVIEELQATGNEKYT